MKSTKLDEIEDVLHRYGVNSKQIEMLYPRLYEPVIPLSATSVPSRTYYYWKKSGLINVVDSNNVEQGWVKINLLDFVWIKMIETMRDFGVPFNKIIETKDILYTNIIKELIADPEGYVNFLRSETTVSEDKIEATEKALFLAKEEFDNSTEEFEIFHTVLGSLVMELLIKNDQGYILIAKNNTEYEIIYMTLKSMSDFQDQIQPYFDVPCLHIPIRSLISDFLEDYKCEKYIGILDLLNLKEKKVIDAMRKKDFKEIIIKQEGKDDSIIIELEKDGDIIDQKAKEVKRILGLNEYSEVTIKYRNDKHLYFKNKTRL